MKVLCFIGSVMISLYLISSGYSLITNPDSYVGYFEKLLNEVNVITENNGFNIKEIPLALDNLTSIKSLGLLEVFAGLLIISEYWIGGFIGLLIVLTSIVRKYYHNIHLFTTWNIDHQREFGVLISMIGLMIYISCCHCSKNSKK